MMLRRDGADSRQGCLGGMEVAMKPSSPVMPAVFISKLRFFLWPSSLGFLFFNLGSSLWGHGALNESGLSQSSQ